jgi:hypothetical protein
MFGSPISAKLRLFEIAEEPTKARGPPPYCPDHKRPGAAVGLVAQFLGEDLLADHQQRPLARSVPIAKSSRRFCISAGSKT